MKIKLAVSTDRYDEIKSTLVACGIEIDDNSDLVLSECNRYIDTLLVKDTISNERYMVPVEEIAYIETFGHSVEVHTKNKSYQGLDRLYRIVSLLDPEKFIRISNSVVVAKDKVRRITPTLSMKYILTMADGKNVDVTRSYYYIFKEYFGI